MVVTNQQTGCVQQDLLDFGVGDLGGLPMSFLQPLEQPAAASVRPAASVQDCEADSDEGGEGGQADPQLLEGSMYMMNDSEPGLTLLCKLQGHMDMRITTACYILHLWPRL